MAIDNSEFSITFSDLTMLESEGFFAEAKKLMESEILSNGHWMLETTASLGTQTGSSMFLLHLWDTGDVYIMEYVSDMGNVVYNPDIQCLSVWAQEKGWSVPKVSKDMAIAQLEFWKYHWETMLVDCEHFDEKFGKRETDYESQQEQP
jgi:hypothetical protein